MSYIQCVATQTQVILTSDGRATDNIHGGIIKEDYNKIRRLNKNLAVAFAGHSPLCEIILDKALADSKGITLNVDVYYSFLRAAAETIIGNLVDLKAQFIIGGLRSVGKLGFKSLSTNNNYMTEDGVPGSLSPICFASAGSDGLVKDILEMKLRELFSNQKEVNMPQLYRTINDTSKYVATIDNTVNKKVFREIIHL